MTYSPFSWCLEGFGNSVPSSYSHFLFMAGAASEHYHAYYISVKHKQEQTQKEHRLMTPSCYTLALTSQ